MGNYNCLTSRSLCLLVLVWPALHTVSSFLLADDTPLSSGTAVVADRDKRDARTVLKLHAYKDLFNDWSVVLTSGSNIYLLRFTGKLNSTIGYNAIASNVSIKPFYDAAFEASNSLNRAYKHGTDEYGTNKFMVDTNQTGTNRADTNGADTTHHADTGETANDHPADDTVEAITDQPRDTLQPEKDDGSWSEPDTLQFIRTQYHRSSNKLILLDNSTGQLITFDTVTLRTKHLALSDRVIDFSVNENSDTLYYLTRRMNILTVHRVGLVMDESRDLSVDESTIYLILRLAATNSWRSRLTIDYLRKSLYLFLMINNRFFSYEMRLVDKTASNYRALSKLCRRRSYCAGKLLYSSGPNEARMLRPWHDSGDSLFVTDPKECKSLNFLVSRDRILDIEVRCPAYSLSIYRVEAARRGNWERDVRRSNFTVHRQSDQYLFSAILDTDDERDIRETIPLRIVVVRSTGRSGNNSAINGSAKRIYAERVSYATECEIEKQQAPSVDRISQASRLPLALIDKVWNDLTDVDSMYIRTKNLFESVSVVDAPAATTSTVGKFADQSPPSTVVINCAENQKLYLSYRCPSCVYSCTRGEHVRRQTISFLLSRHRAMRLPTRQLPLPSSGPSLHRAPIDE